MPEPRVTRLSHLLVDYFTDIQQDDQVLIWAPASTTVMLLMLALYERVLERGGHPHLAPFLSGQDDIFVLLFENIEKIKLIRNKSSL